jgi:hypothetical protein
MDASTEAPLLRTDPLYSPREQTSFIPETLFLNIGIGQPRHAQDDAIVTLIHEGIHWRQCQGSTFGAFAAWVKCSQEQNTFEILRSLPSPLKRELFARRAAGTPILSLSNETSLPDPPLEGADLREDVNMLRMLWFDHLFIYRYFRNSTDVAYQSAALEQIFGSCTAEAATTLAHAHAHPAWASFSYKDLVEYYTLPAAGKVGIAGQELGTKLLLEAAAAATEVLLRATTIEQRFRLTDEGAARIVAEKGPDATGLEADSVWFARDAFDRDVFLERAGEVLRSSYGFALNVFFHISGADPSYHESWLTALAVIDFSLNGPLPPLVLPDASRPSWDELYPPARFVKACVAARRCKGLDLGGGDTAMRAYLADLAAASGLRNPCEYSSAGIHDVALPDFQKLKRGPILEELRGTGVTYYTFVRWCQQALWKERAVNLPLLINPVLLIWNELKEDPARAFAYVTRLDCSAPIICSSEGELDHGAASTTQFGTWLAASSAVHCAATDLMVRVGPPRFPGFPRALLKDERASAIIRQSIQNSLDIDFDPFVGPS